MTATLELVDVRAAYGPIEVVHGVSLRVEQGEVVAVLGPNGAGKSTLVRIISGLMAPTAGHVLMAGHDVTGASGDALARAGVCVIQEGRGIFRSLTVEEHLRLALPTRRPAPELLERVYRQFPRLAERLHQTAGTLSGGEQQMLSLSRALIWQPSLLVIDELSMGLAPILVEQLYETVSALAADGVTIVVIEQFAYEVLELASSAVVLQQGRVVRTDTPAAVARDLAELYLKTA